MDGSGIGFANSAGTGGCLGEDHATPAHTRTASDPLIRTHQSRAMTDCDDLIDDLRRQAHDQVELAIIADATPVVAMHIDLAAFNADQARIAEQLCEDA